MSNSSTIKAAIFDMDGVLTDSEPLINAAAIAMFREKGLTVQPEDFLPFVGAGEDRYLGGVAEKYRFAVNIPEVKRRTYEIYLELVPRRLAAFPGAVELVRACRGAGLRCAVASSADRVKVFANLRQIGLPPEEWDVVVTGEDVVAKKPAPDIFLDAATKLVLTPADCVVIEDAVNGVQAAKAAGMRCVAVAQTFPAERLAAADRVRPTIAEVSTADLLGTEGSPPSPPPDSPGPPQAMPDATAPPPPGSASGSRPIWETLALAAVAGLAWVGVQMAVATVFVLALTLSGRHFAPDQLRSNGMLLGSAACISAPAAVLLCFVFARLRAGPAALEYLGFRWAPVGDFCKWSGALVLLIVVWDLLTVSLGKPIVPPTMRQAFQTSSFLPLLALGLIVAAPIAEETLFRGFLFEGLLRSRLGAAGTILVTSGLWAAIHLQYDAYGVAAIFVSGLLLGWARVRTGSLYLTMFLHGLMNFIASAETLIVLASPSQAR